MSDKTITSIENGMSIIELVISNGGMTQTEVRESSTGRRRRPTTT
ncbi:hypothetical protein ACFQL4_09625 [Halosimplex aquaticum]